MKNISEEGLKKRWELRRNYFNISLLDNDEALFYSNGVYFNILVVVSAGFHLMRDEKYLF